MKDLLGREIEYLRVSVTQNCNLNCIYCNPLGNDTPVTSCSKLSPAEFEAVVRSLAEVGIKKVRITGGEPLTRIDLCDIIGRISKLNGIEDISLTTNGIGLFNKAEELKASGLKRVNISLDSLKSQRFEYITGGGNLKDTLKGIDKAVEVGLYPVKINTVLIKGVNDDEADDFIKLAKDRPVEVRFIELMPIGSYGEQNKDKIVFNYEIINAHEELIPLNEEIKGGPARNYSIKDFKGRIGFISPMSHKFCQSCNRIRLTCDGKIKPCLGSNGEVDISSILRDTPEKLDAFIKDIIFNKPIGHNFDKGFESIRKMNSIGG